VMWICSSVRVRCTRRVVSVEVVSNSSGGLSARQACPAPHRERSYTRGEEALGSKEARDGRRNARSHRGHSPGGPSSSRSSVVRGLGSSAELSDALATTRTSGTGCPRELRASLVALRVSQREPLLQPRGRPRVRGREPRRDSETLRGGAAQPAAAL
jgi:hypothetical protein